MEYQVASAMQEGTPYKAYKKQILGIVWVDVINPFTRQPERVALKGNPHSKTDIETTTIRVWEAGQAAHFEQANKTLFQKGYILPYEWKGEDNTQEKNWNTISDTEIRDLINSPFMKLKHAMDKMTSEAVLYRVLQAAKDEDKSEKLTKAIEERLAMVQLGKV